MSTPLHEATGSRRSPPQWKSVLHPEVIREQIRRGIDCLQGALGNATQADVNDIDFETLERLCGLAGFYANAAERTTLMLHDEVCYGDFADEFYGDLASDDPLVMVGLIDAPKGGES